MKIAVAFLLLLPQLTFAQKVDDKCEFNVSCKLNRREFLLVVSSPAKDCSEDDGQIQFKSKKVDAKLDLPKGWYYEIDNVGSEKSFCKSDHYSEYPVFPVGEKTALMVLRMNRRPGRDSLIVALIDTAEGKVIAKEPLGQTFRHSTGFVKTAKGYKIPLIKDDLKEVRCDCDATFVEGWMEIQVKGKKIVKKWL